jgi:hypothetical protein
MAHRSSRDCFIAFITITQLFSVDESVYQRIEHGPKTVGLAAIRDCRGGREYLPPTKGDTLKRSPLRKGGAFFSFVSPAGPATEVGVTDRRGEPAAVRRGFVRRIGEHPAPRDTSVLFRNNFCYINIVI